MFDPWIEALRTRIEKVQVELEAELGELELEEAREAEEMPLESAEEKQVQL